MSEANTGLNRRQFLTKTSGLSVALALPATNKLSAQQLPTDITQLSASQLSAAIAGRQVRCVEVMQAYLDKQPDPAAQAIYLQQPHHQALWAAWLEFEAS